MVYLISTQTELFQDNPYENISVSKALEMMAQWEYIQFDTETTGRDPHLCSLLSAQFGSPDGNTQIVLDCSTVSITKFAELLMSKTLVMQNGKFDLQFLYKYNITPTKVYDTMIVEQLLHLGWPAAKISYSLKEIAYRYCGVNLDKDIRGQIIWRGLDADVVQYAARDVKYLGEIMEKQKQKLQKVWCERAAEIENRFVPVIAYLEWCGIKLDEEQWKKKMEVDEAEREEKRKALNDFIVRKGFKEFYKIDTQGDLFEGFDLTPKATINWNSPPQVVKVAQKLGFDTKVQDEKTGEDKDTALEKHLMRQKGVCDEFLHLMYGYDTEDEEGNDVHIFGYKEASKLCSTYGQKYLDAINPQTNRIHTTFRQLGASSGRMACGSKQCNTDLAKAKHLSYVGYPQLQNLPADKRTRSCFVAEKGNLFCSCDYSALESRLGADIYQEKAMLDEFLHGSGDMHSLCAKLVFHEELKDVDVRDVKKKRPDLRKKVKSVEFAKQFGGSAKAISQSLGCSKEEAQKFSDAYDRGFAGVTAFGKKGSAFVKSHGFVNICLRTGHKMYWWDWDKWREDQNTYNTEAFKREYRDFHKGTNDAIDRKVREHNKAGKKYDRMALNSPTQGTGIIILKVAMVNFYKWILDNNLFNVVKIVDLVHDEACIEYPETMPNVASVLKQCMEKSAAFFCRSLPIPAEAEISHCWVH